MACCILAVMQVTVAELNMLLYLEPTLTVEQIGVSQDSDW